MKYKLVVYQNADGSSFDVPNAGFTFYTFAQAHACATDWVTQGPSWHARLWDGTEWRVYAG
jgi:hypothetical protein